MSPAARMKSTEASASTTDAVLRLALALDPADDDTVVQWTEFHEFRSRSTSDAGRASCPGLRLGSQGR